MPPRSYNKTKNNPSEGVFEKLILQYTPLKNKLQVHILLVAISVSLLILALFQLGALSFSNENYDSNQSTEEAYY